MRQTMKELRDGESSTITRPPPHGMPNPLPHNVAPNVAQGGYPGLAFLTPGVMFDPASIFQAQLLASIAASNPNTAFHPLSPLLSVGASAAQIFHHQRTNGQMPNVVGGPTMEQLSMWIHPEEENHHGGGGKGGSEDVVKSLTGNNNKSSGGRKRREPNWSTTVARTNKKNKAANGIIGSQNVINSRKTEEMKGDRSDIDITSTTIIPTDKASYKGGSGGGKDKSDEDLGLEQHTNNNISNNNNNSIIANNNNNNHTMGMGSIGQQQQQSIPQFRDKVFTCPICSRCFGYKHVLQNHERTHTGEKPFECTICHKKFTRDHHLKTHMRLHTGEKPYKCTHCDRKFVQVANLRRHLRVHTGERPYACDLCSSRFSDSNQLKAHMLIHKGEKPYSCEECGGRFRRRHHLVHHKCSNKDSNSSSNSNKMSPEPPFLESPPLRHHHVVHHRNHSESPEDSSPTNTMKRERKPRETRRIIRLPELAVATVTTTSNPIHHEGYVTDEPEQDHPEDLSIGGGNALRSRRFSGSHSSCSASPSPPSGGSHGSLDPYCRSITSSDPPEYSSDDEHSVPSDSLLLNGRKMIHD